VHTILFIKFTQQNFQKNTLTKTQFLRYFILQQILKNE